MTYPLIFLFGGLAWRIRGTDHFNAFIRRFGIWATTVAITIAFVTQRPELGLYAWPLVGFGAIFGYWGRLSLDDPQYRTAINYAKLSVKGMVRFLPLFVGASFVGLQWQVLPGIIAGASFPFCYLAGFKLQKFSFPLLRSFTEWGELLFGGVILTALALGLSSCALPNKQQEWEYRGLKQRDVLDIRY